MKIPRVIAHRGASGYAPENTLAAFHKAKLLGAQWVEFDVQLTSDEKLVVIHDETLERTTNGKGAVNEKTLAELQALDAGSWFSEGFENETIPTFVEVLACAVKLNLNVNVEIKSSPGSEEKTVKQVLLELIEYWPKSSATALLSSFNEKCLYLLREMNASYPVAFLMHEWRDDWLAHAVKLKAISVNVNQKILTPERVEAIKAEGYPILSYTVNTTVRAKALFAMGVNGVFTDFVDEIQTNKT